mmetsp:Transcript_47855/g.121405  ORF Transcript_47855/g.121405 Transcript_47855/m.121405 type:complete len:335 (+) Transcript_47855:18-1022(+)
MVVLTCWRPLSEAATESQDIPRRLTSGTTAKGGQRSSEVMSPCSSCSSSTSSSSVRDNFKRPNPQASLLLFLLLAVAKLVVVVVGLLLNLILCTFSLVARIFTLGRILHRSRDAARPPLRPLCWRRCGRLCLCRALLGPRGGARGPLPASAGRGLDPAQGGPNAVGLRPARELEATMRGELLLQLLLGLLVPRKGEVHQRVTRALEVLDLMGLGAVHHGGDTLHVDRHALLVWERRGFRHGPGSRVLRPMPQLAACEISKRPNDRQAAVVDVSVAGCSVVFVQADGRERKQFTFLEPRGRIVGQVAAEGPRHAGEGCALGGQRQLAVGSNPHQT